jgi:sugar phosphate isomerase/epimerase
MHTRRLFLQATAGAAAVSAAALASLRAAEKEARGDNIAFGLVTYQWGNDWDLPTLLANCQKTKTLGVELRTTHSHKVEPALSEKQRQDVQKQFADSGVTLVGIGSNERFDSPDPAVLKKAIDATKDFIRLSHDVGGSGVKVKPDTFHKDVPREKTIEQIGKALNEVGEYAAGFGQQVRLEIHGGCAEIPVIAAIMKVATNDNVAVCWNSNAQDLQGEGLEANFKLVRERFGATVHVRELDDKVYPFDKLMKLLVDTDYNGWVLLEASSQPADRVAALAQQKELFDKLMAKAR